MTRSSAAFYLLGAVFVGAAAGAWWWSATERPVLAVAIVENETGRDELDRYAAGLSDAALAHLESSRTPRMGLIDAARDVRRPRSYGDLNALREATGATFVLFAQLQHTDSGLRLTAQIIRVSDGRHVWVGQINRPATMEGLADIEQQLLHDVTYGVREHVMGEPPASSTTTPAR